MLQYGPSIAPVGVNRKYRPYSDNRHYIWLAASIEAPTTFRLKYYLNNGNSYPKIVGNRPFVSMIFVVCLSHEIFHPVAGIVFLQISFW